MRDDFSPCCLLALPLLAGNKVNPGMNYRSLSLRDKRIHINKTVHKIFWEAGNRRLKSTRSTNDRLRITINSLKLPYEANSKHYEISKILQIALFRNVFQRRTEKEAVFWSLGLIYLSQRCELDRVTIEIKHSNNFTHEPLWVVTHTVWFLCKHFLLFQ